MAGNLRSEEIWVGGDIMPSIGTRIVVCGLYARGSGETCKALGKAPGEVFFSVIIDP